jgi:hypothetical protein
MARQQLSSKIDKEKLEEKVFMLKLKHLVLNLVYCIKRNIKDKEDERKHFARNAKQNKSNY